MTQPSSLAVKKQGPCSRPRSGGAAPASAAAVTALTMGVTRDVLEPLVEQIADAVAARVQLTPQPSLLDRNDLASALGISTATVDRLSRAGMPAIRLVDSKRYLLADVLVWLKSRKQEP